jgi:hypothetical protein
MKVYSILLKTREQMEKEIPRDLWGWWIDVCPGKILTVRNATKKDIARCSLRHKAPRSPKYYYCELSKNGALISKIAVQHATELTA